MEYKYIILILILFLIIDLPMIGRINNKMYQTQFNRINNGPMETNKVTIISAIICYFLLAIGTYYFVVKPGLEKNSSNIDIFLRGMLAGLVTYGIYNTTNKITINKFGVRESIIDTLWGTVLTGIVASISFIIIKKNII